MRRVIKRTAIGLMVVLAAALSAGAPLHAETYPSRALTIISPHPVGVATDILARALARQVVGRP